MGEEGELGGRIEGKCQVCAEREARYRCPGCDAQTCSLGCVKTHKQSTGCTGKRVRHTVFVPLAALTPEMLHEDCGLLEEAATSTKLLARSLPGGQRQRQRHRALSAKCAERSIVLQLLPAGMTRAKLNRSAVREDGIVWTVEWIWLGETAEHPVNMRLDDLKGSVQRTLYSQCPESASIAASYAQLRGDDSSSSRSNAELPVDCTVMLRQEPDKDGSSAIAPARRLWPLHSLETSWQLLLASRTIIEFPTVYIQERRRR